MLRRGAPTGAGAVTTAPARTALGALTLLAAVTVLASCEARGSGVEAQLRVPDATYVPGPPPSSTSTSGPRVASLDTPRSAVEPGEPTLILSATFPAEANGISVFHPRDPGHWRLPVGPRDAFSLEVLTLEVRAELSSDTPLGPFDVELRATDRAGVTGPARALSLDVVAAPVEVAPLVVTLRWEGAADLDLRVTLPDGVELGPRNPSAFVRGGMGDGGSFRDAARLEVDAQAGCARASRPRERVRWPTEPTPGRYVVRVDTFSLCGDAAAPWRVTVDRAGTRVAEAEGLSTVYDVRFGHDLGAGRVVLDVELP
jgi:hypothetical protein